MNGFYLLLFVIIITIFGGIFYMTQKDSVLSNVFQPSPSPILPADSDKFQLLSLPSQPAKEQNTQNEQIAPTFGVEEGVKASYSATISTSKGSIKITLDGASAPQTVLNFINKAKSGFYKNLTFHRVEDWVIQGGDPKGDGTGGGLMQTELNTLPFIAGSLGVARGQNPNISNDSQFFITKSEASWLNGQYTNFGTVTEGLEVVNNIQIGDKILKIIIEQ